MPTSPTISPYCERLASGFWAEPANFISNAAFLLVAIWAYRKAKNAGLLQDRSVRWLLGWLTAVGIGSGLFHSLATPWSKACDVAPIAIFVASFYGIWLHQVVGLNARRVILAYLALAGVSALSLALCRSPVFAGSQGYFGVLLLMPVLGLDQWRRFGGKPRLLQASLAFAIALLCRTIDQPLCPWLPLGTHWLWHLLNAYVCLKAMVALVEAKHV